MSLIIILLAGGFFAILFSELSRLPARKALIGWLVAPFLLTAAIEPNSLLLGLRVPSLGGG